MMNTSVLRDKTYQDIVKDTVRTLGTHNITDPKFWWRVFIRTIRSKTIIYTTHKNKVSRTVQTKLRREMEDLESVPEPDMTAAQNQRLLDLREKLKAFELQAIEGHRIRTKGLPRFEQHEPNIAFFADLEKQQGQKMFIKELQDEDEEVHTAPLLFFRSRLTIIALCSHHLQLILTSRLNF